jgi:hypothetical protein
VIYVESEHYISHGCDDFSGGLAEVSEVSQGTIKGEPVPFVCLVQQPGTLHYWSRLAAEQKELRQIFGKNWAGPDPDLRPEFNGYFL